MSEKGDQGGNPTGVKGGRDLWGLPRCALALSSFALFLFTQCGATVLDHLPACQVLSQLLPRLGFTNVPVRSPLLLSPPSHWPGSLRLTTSPPLLGPAFAGHPGPFSLPQAQASPSLSHLLCFPSSLPEWPAFQQTPRCVFSVWGVPCPWL